MNTTHSNPVLEEFVRGETGKPSPRQFGRAVICRILDSGEVIVRLADHPEPGFSCDVLLTGNRLVLKVGDPVLILAPAGPGERGVVLGLIGPYAPPAPPPSPVVEHLEVKAGESLALRCGESSLELRKDGKVLLKGKDIVSHAKRVQRIKGGAVAIN